MDVHTEVHDGMTVRSRDGEKLGKIVRCEEDTFIIERGLFFPKDYMARYDEIVDVRDTDVFIAMTKDDLESGRAAAGDASARGTASTSSTEGASNGASAQEIAGRTTTQTTAMPLHEEQLDAQKEIREAGEVRIQKDVVTEERQITVPVSHEEVRVERVEAADAPATGEMGFQKEEIRIPIHEEQVELRKTPVVTEEVRVTKQGVTEEKTLAGEVRKEVAKVRKEGDIREREVPPSSESKR